MKLNELKKWFPVGCLALAAFVFIISELMPVGLLTEISEGINETEARTGLLLTGYAWIVALVSLPLTLLTAKINRKILLVCVMLVFCLGCVLGSYASSFEGIFYPRIFIAFSHGIFWSISTPLAVRLSPGGKHAIGLGIISAGVALGTVLGIPIATYLGQLFGWTAAFKFIAVISAMIAVLFSIVLPPLPSQNTGSLKSIPELIRNKTLMRVYLMIILIVTGHFISYTFLRPYLHSVVGVETGKVVYILFAYGITGVLGIFLAGKYMDRYLKAVLISSIVAIFGCFAMLAMATQLLPAVTVLLVWSVAMSALGLAMQSWVLRLAPQTADAAVSVYSSLYNVGIGSGALIGGIVVERLGTGHVGLISALFIAPAILILISTGKK